MFTAKYSNDGTRLWTRQLGTTASDEGYSLAIDEENNIYVTGQTEEG